MAHRVALSCAVAVALASCAGAEPPRFYRVGSLSTAYPVSWANAVSADGRVVVGETSHESGGTFSEPFRWTREEGMVGLGEVPRGIFFAPATSVSADGSVICGHSGVEYGMGDNSFRWTAEEGFTMLSDMRGIVNLVASAVSADASTIVGWWEPSGGTQRAFRWRAATGIEDLGLLHGASPTWATAVSADGNTVVGWSIWEDYAAFVWTPGGGVHEVFYDKSWGTLMKSAEAVTPDGKTVVGWGFIGDRDPYKEFDGAARCPVGGTGGGGPIAPIPGFSRRGAMAYGVSADGRVIVGSGDQRAWFGSAERGVRDLREYLLRRGVEEVRGWDLGRATGVSADGRIIVGHGDSPEGHVEGWVVDLGDDCPPDCDGDGGLGASDLLCFQSKWRARDVYADYDRDGRFTVRDFLAYQVEFRLGCP